MQRRDYIKNLIYLVSHNKLALYGHNVITAVSIWIKTVPTYEYTYFVLPLQKSDSCKLLITNYRFTEQVQYVAFKFFKCPFVNCTHCQFEYMGLNTQMTNH